MRAARQLRADSRFGEAIGGPATGRLCLLWSPRNGIQGTEQDVDEQNDERDEEEDEEEDGEAGEGAKMITRQSKSNAKRDESRRLGAFNGARRCKAMSLTRTGYATCLPQIANQRCKCGLLPALASLRRPSP